MQIPEQYSKYGLALDAAAHWLHCYCPNEIPESRYTLHDRLCRKCGRPVVYRYHESRLYTICCKRCGYTFQIEAGNPEQAAEFVTVDAGKELTGDAGSKTD